MRILVAGDLQIGAGAKIGRTLADYDELLNRIVGIAEAQRADLFLGLGDAFQSRTTNRDQDEVFMRFLVSMSDVCPVLWVNGNHDWRGYERATTVGIFANRDHTVAISATPEHHWYSAPDGSVVVATLPWAALGHLVADSDGADRSELVARASEHLVTIAADLREQIEPGATAILAGHWAVSGASLPTGLPVDMLAEPVIEIAELEAQGWDVIAMGHVHKAQSIGERGGAFVCGSPYVCDWGETGFDHGVWLLEPDAATHEGAQKMGLAPSFLRVPDRTFRTLDISAEHAIEIVEAEWHGADVADAVVRIRVQATEEQARRINATTLRREAEGAGAHFVAPIQVDVERAERQRVEGLSEELGEMEALRLWCASVGINGAREAALTDRTQRYLEAVR